MTLKDLNSRILKIEESVHSMKGSCKKNQHDIDHDLLLRANENIKSNQHRIDKTEVINENAASAMSEVTITLRLLNEKIMNAEDDIADHKDHIDTHSTKIKRLEHANTTTTSNLSILADNITRLFENEKPNNKFMNKVWQAVLVAIITSVIYLMITYTMKGVLKQYMIEINENINNSTKIKNEKSK